MNKIIPLLLLFAFILGCGNETPQQESKREVLRIGTDATYPPFEMIGMKTGEPEGFDIDLITAICKLNGWKPDFIVTPFDGMIPGLMNKKYDVAISSITITPQREAVVDFSEPYYLAGQVIAVPLKDSTIKVPSDLKGKRVGVQLGTTGEIMAKKLPGVQVFSFDNIGAAFIDMANGNLDAVLNDFPTTQAYIKQNNTAKVVGNVLSEEYYGMAFRRSEGELRIKVDSALNLIINNGTYAGIYKKWFGEAPPDDFLKHITGAADSLAKDSMSEH